MKAKWKKPFGELLGKTEGDSQGGQIGKHRESNKNNADIKETRLALDEELRLEDVKITLRKIKSIKQQEKTEERGIFLKNDQRPRW